MEKILKQIAKHVRKNAVEGAGNPSAKTLFEVSVPEKLVYVEKKTEEK